MPWAGHGGGQAAADSPGLAQVSQGLAGSQVSKPSAPSPRQTPSAGSCSQSSAGRWAAYLSHLDSLALPWCFKVAL